MVQQLIPLIASENILSPAVERQLYLISEIGMQKDGLKERVFAGCMHIDQVEIICK